MASKKINKKNVRRAKKFAKKNPKIFVAIVVLVVLAVAAFMAYWFISGHTADDLVALFTSSDSDNSKAHESNGSDAPRTPATAAAFSELADTGLYFHMINVGQGDCLLIQFPDGKDMLIDCANYNNSSEYRSYALDYIGQYVTDGQLDYLMLTHCDSDHVYFMDEVLDEYDVDKIFMPNVLAVPESSTKAATVNALDSEKLALFTDEDTVSTACYADFFIAALSEEGAEITLNIGEFSIEGTDYSIDFYCYTAEEWTDTDLNSAEEKNAVSPIGVLSYHGIDVVLTGDSNQLNEPKFIEKIGTEIPDCEVLKVGHHGSETSSTADFLDFIHCEYALISCNASGNSFNHPRQATLDRLAARNMTVYRTDLNGTIVLKIDETGKFAFSVQTETQE